MDLSEKVLDGIEEVRDSGIQCPLENVEPHRCFHFPEKLIDDIVSLLKAQKPVKPIDETCWDNTMGRCGHCKAPLPKLEGLKSKFCWMCGRAVKWE